MADAIVKLERKDLLGDLIEVRQSQQSLLSARQAYLSWAQTERSKWWWNRAASARELDADIARTQRQIQQYQEQIGRINAELQRRGVS